MEGFVLHILKLNLLAAAVILSVKALTIPLKNHFTAGWKYLVWLAVAVTLLVPLQPSSKMAVLKINVMDDSAPETSINTSEQSTVNTAMQNAANGKAQNPANSTMQNPGNNTMQNPGNSTMQDPGNRASQASANIINPAAADSAPSGKAIEASADRIPDSSHAIQALDKTPDTRMGAPAAPVTQTAPGRHDIRLSGKGFPLHRLSVIFLVLWLTVAFAKLLWNLLGYVVSMKNLQRMSIPAANPLIARMYRDTCRREGLRRSPELMQNAGLTTPLLTGLFTPRLYLPAVGYTAEELKLVFSHELTHYRRKDLWYKMLLQICAAVYWFNPALSLMLAEADQDIENLCDSRVLRISRQPEHKIYRQLLLKTASLKTPVPYVSASLNDSSMIFKERILYMLNIKNMRRSPLPAILLIALLALGNSACAVSSETVSSGNGTASQAEAQTVRQAEAVDSVKTSPAISKAPAPPTPAVSVTPSHAPTAAPSASPDRSVSTDALNADAGSTAGDDTQSTDARTSTVSGNSSTANTSAQANASAGNSSASASTGNTGNSGVPYTDGDTDSQYVASILPSGAEDELNSPLYALRDNGNGTYTDDSGTSYTYQGNATWKDENGNTYNTYFDRTHYYGTELDSRTLQAADGSTTSILQTTNGDYLYRDDNSVGFTDNGDGTWTDENGNTYTEQ